MFVLMNLFNVCVNLEQREGEKECTHVRKLLLARLSEVTMAKPDVKQTLFLNLYFHVMVKGNQLFLYKTAKLFSNDIFLE